MVLVTDSGQKLQYNLSTREDELEMNVKINTDETNTTHNITTEREQVEQVTLFNWYRENG